MHTDNMKMLEVFSILWEVFLIYLLTQSLPNSDLLPLSFPINNIIIIF